MANVLLNGNFELGTVNWNFFTNGTGGFTTQASGSTSIAKLTITTTGTNVQLNQSGITLEPNTNYTLSFKAYSVSGNNFVVKLFQNVSPYTVYGLETEVELTNAWQTYTFTFTTTNFTSTVTDARLMFWLAGYAAAGDVYYIDDVNLSIATLPPPNNSWTYQWQKNGVNIVGETNSTYTTPLITGDMNGTEYSVILTQGTASYTSSVAKLFVTNSSAGNYAQGYLDGYTTGSKDGYAKGYLTGSNDGYKKGYATGSSDGYKNGYSTGSADGYTKGYITGSKDGYANGYTTGSADGYAIGYNDGLSAQGSSSCHTVEAKIDALTATINKAIIDIGSTLARIEAAVTKP